MIIGLPWGRIKVIREFIIPYEADDLLEIAYLVSDLDTQIKFGKLAKENLLDHFICLII